MSTTQENRAILKEAMTTIITAEITVETRSRWLAYLAAIHLDGFVGSMDEAFDAWNDVMVEVATENNLGRH